MNRAILIHGWEGTPQEGWKPWLKHQLEQQSFQVTVPAMPDTNHPTMAAWVRHLTEVVGRPDQRTYLVGHSLGCITILRYLETLTGDAAIGGAVLVAGFATDLTAPGYEGQLASFFDTPIQWPAIQRRCPKFVAVNSDNDKWVDLRNLQTFQAKLGAEGILLHHMGHFSGDDGFTELPIVYDKLLSIAS